MLLLCQSNKNIKIINWVVNLKIENLNTLFVTWNIIYIYLKHSWLFRTPHTCTFIYIEYFQKYFTTCQP